MRRRSYNRPWPVSGTEEIDEPWALIAGVHYALVEPLTVTYCGRIIPGDPGTHIDPPYGPEVDIEVLLAGQPCPENTFYVKNYCFRDGIRMDRYQEIGDMLIDRLLEQEPHDDFDEDRDDDR